MLQEVVLCAAEGALGQAAHVILEDGVRDEGFADLFDLLRLAEHRAALEVGGEMRRRVGSGLVVSTGTELQSSNDHDDDR